MTPIRSTLLLASMLLWCHTLLAQTASAEDYFNRAAKQYVKEDKVSALRTLDKGLQQHPGDPRLLKLAEELLKEEQPQQQTSPQDQQQKEEKQDDQQGKDDKSDQGKQDEKQDDGNKQDRRDESSDKPKPQPGRISPQDAERMLDAMNRQEKDVQDKVRNRQRPTPRIPIDKDW